MTYIDFHADTITELLPEETLQNNHKMIRLSELRKADCLVQCFSAYVDAGSYSEEQRDALCFAEYERIRGRYEETVTAYAEFLTPIRSRADLEKTIRDKKIGTIFTIEDGSVLGGSMEKLAQVYEDGVRLITLTWNYGNAIGYPNSVNPEEMRKGLNPFGLELLSEMEQRGMIVDVSHLSDGGFWDVYHNTEKPFVASHSNARSLTAHPRNLTDEMIRKISERGGIIGLNLYGPFLSEDGKSRISDMVRHVQHLYQTGGEDVLAIGSDFDGIVGELELSKPTELVHLYEALKRAGIPSSVLEKMWAKNGLRVLRECLK